MGRFVVSLVRLLDLDWGAYVELAAPASLDALDGVPFTVEETLAALAAASDIVGFCLKVDDSVRDLVTGGGMLSALKLGSVLFSFGTGLPRFTDGMTGMVAPSEWVCWMLRSAAAGPSRNGSPRSSEATSRCWSSTSHVLETFSA